MFITVLLVLFMAKLKHYKVRYLFYTWSFYPILIIQAIVMFFQISIFAGNYYYIQFASVINIAIILSFVFPLFVFDLYKPALIGSALVVVGTILNKFAMAQNSGKMPIFPSLSYLTGYVKPEMFNTVDNIHVLGNSSTPWRILTDYIDVGYSVLSPGDLLIHSFTFIMLYYTIKAVNTRFAKEEKTEAAKDD